MVYNVTASDARELTETDPETKAPVSKGWLAQVQLAATEAEHVVGDKVLAAERHMQALRSAIAARADELGLNLAYEPSYQMLQSKSGEASDKDGPVVTMTIKADSEADAVAQQKALVAAVSDDGLQQGLLSDVTGRVEAEEAHSKLHASEGPKGPLDHAMRVIGIGGRGA